MALRVMYIVHRFPPNFLGGADIYTYTIADEMRKLGHGTAILCAENIHDPTTGPNEVRVADEPYDGLPVRRLYFNWRRMSDPYGSLYVSNPTIEQLTQAYIHEVKPDLVHVTACDYVTSAVITASKRTGLPTVLTLTGKWHICPVATLLRGDGELCAGRQPGLTCLHCLFGKTRTYKALTLLPKSARQRVIAWTERHPQLFRHIGSLNFVHAIESRNRLFQAVLAQVDHIISPSHCHRDVFAKSGVIPTERIDYSPYGHNVERAAQGRTKIPSAALRFGYTSQIVSHKGADTLVLAFNRLQANGRAALSVYGQSDLEPAFGNSVRSLAADNTLIEFRGRFENRDIGKVLAGIDVLVVPSKCVENTPLTIAEAFAANTPVIGSDVCGIAEYIEDGVNGLLFRRGDPDDLARQMQRILDEPSLLLHLRQGIPAVRPVSDEVHELEMLYSRLALVKHDQ